MDLLSDTVHTRLQETMKDTDLEGFSGMIDTAQDNERQLRERWRVEFWELYGEQIISS